MNKKINNIVLKTILLSMVVTCLFTGETIVSVVATGSQITGNNEKRIYNSNIRSPVQLIIIDDGSGDPTDKQVDIPAYIPDSGITPVLETQFSILGTSPTGIQQYYGDDSWEDWKNITISGDILYPVNKTTLTHSSNGNWTAFFTPMKPGGIFTLTIDWPGADNGSANQTVEIVNGTTVVSPIDIYTFGEETNICVTVTDMDGDPVKTAQVYLFWEENDCQFNSTVGDNTAGNGLNGEYVFTIRADEQGSIPKHITIAAMWYTGFWGYTKVTPVVFEPDLAITVKGFFGLTVIITNDGDTGVNNVNVSVDLNGGIILRPTGGHTFFLISEIRPGNQTTMKIPVFGFGRTEITAEAVVQGEFLTSITKTAFIFGPLVFLF